MGNPFLNIDRNSSNNFWIEIWRFSFQISFRNQFLTSGSGQRGKSAEESNRPTRKSPKNEELFRIAYMDYPRLGTRKSLIDRLGRALKRGVFWIAYMDRPRVGGVWLDWCTLQPTHRALKTRSCSRLHSWIVHAWELGRVSSTDSEEP